MTDPVPQYGKLSRLLADAENAMLHGDENEALALVVDAKRILQGIQSGTVSRPFAVLSDADDDPFVPESTNATPAGQEVEPLFGLGARVEKKRGSAWHGRVVGFYSTGLTPIGYAVESEREPGSVQIYPEAALRLAATPSVATPADDAGVRDGWKLVPIKPTLEMLNAPWDANLVFDTRKAQLIYASMIQAVPGRSIARWRPEIVAFADLMEGQLRANDHKPGWKGDALGDLFARIREEADELAQAIDAFNDGTFAPDVEKAKRRNAVGREAADVANFALMIADAADALAADALAASPKAPSVAIDEHDAFRLRKVAEADCGVRIPAPYDEVADHLATVAFDEAVNRCRGIAPSVAIGAGKVCCCAEVAGEDPQCPLHGRETLWAKENPDICELAEQLADLRAALAPASASIPADVEREAYERCASIAEKWRDENKASAAKARRVNRARGDNGMADMLDGAAIECNAIAQEIRALAARPSPVERDNGGEA